MYARGDDVAEADIDLKRQACPGDFRVQRQTDAAVFFLEACRLRPDRLWLEGNAIIAGGKRADFAEYRFDALGRRIAESEKIKIAGRAIGSRRPKTEEHRPLEDELFTMGGKTESIQQPLDRVADQRQLAPAARAANRLSLRPPFPPEAERCALMCVESIICIWPERPR